LSDEQPTQPQSLADIQVDTSNLYREELITDLRVASIRKLTPIKPDGSDDPNREPLFTGQTTLMSQGGPVPVQCQLEGSTLEEATAHFPQGIQDAVDRLVEEAREMQRREASRIVVPGEIPGGLKGPGGGSGIIS
jgi:hypothetical protein